MCGLEGSSSCLCSVCPPIQQGRGCLVQFEFQKNNCVHPMHCWGHAFTKKLFIVYPERKLSQASGISSGQRVAETWEASWGRSHWLSMTPPPHTGPPEPLPEHSLHRTLSQRPGSSLSEARVGSVFAHSCARLGRGRRGLGPDVRRLLDSRCIRDSSEREEIPTSNSPAKPCLAPGAVAGHLLGWAAPPSLLLSGIPLVPASTAPSTVPGRLPECLAGMMALRGPGSQAHLEPLTASLEGGGGLSVIRASGWARRPLGSGSEAARIKVRECLGSRAGRQGAARGWQAASQRAPAWGCCYSRGRQLASVGEGPVPRGCRPPPPPPTSWAPPPGCLLPEQTKVARRKSPSQGRPSVLTTEGRSHHPAHR